MSIQHDQPVCVHDIEMGAAVQPLEESTSSLPNAWNEPLTDVPHDEENNENEVYDGKETVNIPSPPNNDVEFDIHSVHMPISSYD